MELAPGTWVDRFAVETTVGVGGMGTVHRVRHRELDSIHALKVPHEATPQRLTQLRREARIQARVRHPNVTLATDLVQVDDRLALVMEFVGGATLETVIRGMRVPRFEMELLIPGLLAGVAALHAGGVVHRDLKPGNVLLSVQGRRVVPRLIDFGLASEIGGRRRDSGSRDFGTPHYMAPEQLRDPTLVDPRLDVYALGAMLYELATGQRAFPSDDPRVVMEAASRGHIVAVRELAPDLPERMARAIEGALHANPERRIANCAALWRAWSGPEGPSLEEAAHSTLGWRGVWLEELHFLAPPLVPLPPLARAVPPSPHDSPPQVPRPALRPTRAWSWPLLLAATLVGILLIGAGTLLAAWLVTAERASWSKSDPVHPRTSHLASPGAVLPR
ncbi:MAG: serine/threonine-protein kinase [Myxococcota bacterium]